MGGGLLAQHSGLVGYLGCDGLLPELFFERFAGILLRLEDAALQGVAIEVQQQAGGGGGYCRR